MVTAAPLVGLTDPVLLMRIESFAVPVATGVVTAVLITVSAFAAGAASAVAKAPTAAVVKRVRVKKYPLCLAAAASAAVDWTSGVEPRNSGSVEVPND
jgi:hypothetical protein